MDFNSEETTEWILQIQTIVNSKVWFDFLKIVLNFLLFPKRIQIWTAWDGL